MRSHTRPSYRGNTAGPPERRLLAAVVKRAVLDLNSASPELRAEAREFLSTEEGVAWLRAFGIPEQKARELLEAGRG